MFLFSKSDTPAVRAHLNAQAAFLNDMSKSLSRSFQEMCQLNIQLGQTMLEESTIVSHQLLTAERPADLMSATATRAQPASEKLRAYQQHLSRVAADSQVDFAKVAEQHVHETSRTARALAEQVANSAAEETDRTIRHQEEVLKNFRDPFAHANAQRGNGSTYQGSMQSAGEGAGGSIDSDTEYDTFKGNVQGSQSSQVSQQSKTAKSA
ncbi:TIGR01841 family phasin [Massilia sp. BSC265]|uniref:TIGR01841 family phasin n=1 Tax=Massilia sp. BSC265 TaxID=1549812 RepID=UPI0005613BC5|nr:TIGR01841 family phasin [Massilia sp. BSC265]